MRNGGHRQNVARWISMIRSIQVPAWSLTDPLVPLQSLHNRWYALDQSNHLGWQHHIAISVYASLWEMGHMWSSHAADCSFDLMSNLPRVTPWPASQSLVAEATESGARPENRTFHLNQRFSTAGPRVLKSSRQQIVLFLRATSIDLELEDRNELIQSASFRITGVQRNQRASLPVSAKLVVARAAPGNFLQSACNWNAQGKQKQKRLGCLCWWRPGRNMRFCDISGHNMFFWLNYCRLTNYVALCIRLWLLLWVFKHALGATLWTCSWNFQHAFDATLLTCSRNFRNALDATLLTCSWNSSLGWLKAIHS